MLRDSRTRHIVLWGLVGLYLSLQSVHAQQSPPASQASGVISTTTCTASVTTGCVTLTTSGYGSVAIQVTGTFSATLTFTASVNGSTFVALNCSTSADATVIVTGATAAGLWNCNVGGFAQVRVKASVHSSGNVLVTIQAATSSAGNRAGGGGGGAPTDATYITQTPNSSLSAEQALGSLATGLMNSATTTGVVSTLAPTDDNLVVGSGVAWELKALTTCTGAGKAVTYDASSNAFGCNTISAGLSDAFTSVPVSGQTTISASGATALTVAAGSNVTLTTDNTTKTLTIAAAAGGAGSPRWIGPFTVQFNTANLNTGVTITTYTPVVGDFLCDMLVIIGDGHGNDAFDGTTPTADVGYSIQGIFAFFNGALDASDVSNTTISGGHASAADSSNFRLLTSSIASVGGLPNPAPLPWIFNDTTPLKVWVSRDGLTTGLAVGGTAGTLKVYLLIATPIP